MTTKSQVRKFMRLELEDLDHPDLWQGGEVNCTRLAENAAWHFDCDHWLDDPDHWVWELAADIQEEAEKTRFYQSRSSYTQ